MLDWIKSKATTIGMAITAVLMVLLAAKVVNKTKAARRKEKLAVELQASLVFKDLQKSKKLIKSAERDKQTAKTSKEEMAYKLEKLSEQNTDIDALANAFNSKRVREPATP